MSCHGHYIRPHLPFRYGRVHTCILSRSDDIATMTTMIGDPAVLSTTPVYNPPPVTRAPQGQLMTPSPQGQQMTPAPHQGQQMTSTGQAAVSLPSGEDLLSRVRSDQVAINGDKCMFALSLGHFAAMSKHRGRVLIHVRDYVIDALSGKMYATKRGVAMKVDESENLKSIDAIDAAITILLQEK